MDLRYSESDVAFRAELREFLDRSLPELPSPPRRDDWPARVRYDTDWQRRLFDAGYAGMNWPKEYGGRDASPSEQLIFLEETTRARAPYVGVNFVGPLHAGPTIIAEGTPEQKAAHLPKILRGEEVWCQGFSEPNAGSDLASLRTRAVRDGDHYVVTGQKIWCSFGHVGDFGELLVRTDPDVAEAQGHQLVHAADGPARHRGAADRDGARLVGVLRAVPRRGARPGREPGRARERRLARHQRDAVVRARHRVRERARRRDAARRRARRRWSRIPVDRRELGHVAAELDALWALTQAQRHAGGARRRRASAAMIFKLAYSEARDRLGELSMRVLGRDALDVRQPVRGGAAADAVASRSRRARRRSSATSSASGCSDSRASVSGSRQPMHFDLTDDQERCATASAACCDGPLPMAA